MIDYAAHIRAVRAQATPADIARGRDWYRAARRIVDAIADWAGVEPDRVAAMLAALSPRNPWHWNVQDAAAFALAVSRGDPMPSATTFRANRATAYAFGAGTGDWRTAAPKVRSFVANIMGDTEAVTVDVWAARVATGGTLASPPRGQYAAIADAYRTVAREYGETPRDLQAITWTTAERMGLGSNRRSRHGVTLKRGTFSFVAELLAG